MGFSFIFFFRFWFSMKLTKVHWLINANCRHEDDYYVWHRMKRWNSWKTTTTTTPSIDSYTRKNSNWFLFSARPCVGSGPITNRLKRKSIEYPGKWSECCWTYMCFAHAHNNNIMFYKHSMLFVQTNIVFAFAARKQFRRFAWPGDGTINETSNKKKTTTKKVELNARPSAKKTAPESFLSHIICLRSSFIRYVNLIKCVHERMGANILSGLRRWTRLQPIEDNNKIISTNEKIGEFKKVKKKVKQKQRENKNIIIKPKEHDMRQSRQIIIPKRQKSPPLLPLPIIH